MANIYRASLVSLIVVDAGGRATLLGIAENFTVTKNFEAEALREIGNFFAPEIVIHGVMATFCWGKAWQKGVDLVAQGIVPAMPRSRNTNPMPCGSWTRRPTAHCHPLQGGDELVGGRDHGPCEAPPERAGHLYHGAIRE